MVLIEAYDQLSRVSIEPHGGRSFRKFSNVASLPPFGLTPKFVRTVLHFTSYRYQSCTSNSLSELIAQLDCPIDVS